MPQGRLPVKLPGEVGVVLPSTPNGVCAVSPDQITSAERRSSDRAERRIDPREAGGGALSGGAWRPMGGGAPSTPTVAAQAPGALADGD